MLQRILAAALLALAATLPLAAPTVAERSPFTQGQWWDPTRSGQGFELLSVGDQGMAIWFTFDDTRRPVWYTAQGTLGTPWTLLRHFWDRGAPHLSLSQAVGTLELKFLDDAQADAVFTVHGRSGTYRIEPFLPGTKTNEIDHSGSYFDPLAPGWGFTLTEQGDVLGGVLYTYDPGGFPRWVAGFARDSNGSVPVVSVRGPCPGCDPGPTDRSAAGRIEIAFLSDRMASLTVVLDESMAPSLQVDSAKLVQLGRPAADRIADRVAANFPSSAALKAHLDAAMPNMAFQGNAPLFPGPVSIQERALRHLQDSDANECDPVQSSGRYVYAFGHDGDSRPTAHLRVAEVGAEGRSLDVRSDSVPLASGFNTPTFAAALCLGESVLASVTGTLPFVAGADVGSSTGYMKGRTYVEVFGLGDPARPASRWWAELDGHPLASFRIGERLYVVLRHAPTLQGYDYRGTFVRGEANRELLASTPLAAMLPRVRPFGGEATPLVSASSTYLRAHGARRTANFVTVVAIDLREPRIVDALAVLGTATAVSVTGNNLYLSSLAFPGTGIGNSASSTVYHVRLGEAGLSLAASGAVSGVLRMQAGSFGQLRVFSGARLSILEPGFSTPEFLRTGYTLPNASRPLDIGGAPARFAGDRLYVAGPSGGLFVVDLSDPQDPKVSGALDTTTPLESLHPLADGRLVATSHTLGFFGIVADLSISLFNVRDGIPSQFQRVPIAQGNATNFLKDEPYAMALAARPDGTAALAIPAQVPASPAPGLETRFLLFEVREPRAISPGFARYPDFPTPGSGPVLAGARALIYPEAVVSVVAGRFYRQDINANVTGPF